MAYKTPLEIIQTLIDVVAKNGNLLLNVGPKADGSIAKHDQDILETIGNWLSINGEAIYGAKVWRKAQEGPTRQPSGQFSDSKPIYYTTKDFRFTVSGNSIYVFIMGRLSGPEQLTIKALATSKDQDLPEFHGIIEKVFLLGKNQSLLWKQTSGGLKVEIPKVSSDLPQVLKVQVR